MHYRGAKRPTTLGAVAADTDALFARLVREGASMRFAPDSVLAARAAAGESVDEEETEEGGGAFRTPVTMARAPGAAGSHDEADDADERPDRLRTRLGPAALEKRLLRFHRDARLLEEEQGVDILYLAIGFLRWYEDERSQVLREAPLVLVPVSLVRDARRSTFDLRAREEDIGLNLPLSERLKELGIALPPIPEGDEWLPFAYFRRRRRASLPSRRLVPSTGARRARCSPLPSSWMFHDLEPPGTGRTTRCSAISLLQGPPGTGLRRRRPPPLRLTRAARRSTSAKRAPSDLVHIVDADHYPDARHRGGAARGPISSCRGRGTGKFADHRQHPRRRRP